MKIEMTTGWLPLIQPGLYETYLGEMLNDIHEDYTTDFKNKLCLESVSVMNEIFSEDWFVNIFGNVIASDATLHSPQWYNYENDRIDFDLEIEEQKIFDYWNTFEEWNKEDFFKWTKENYGSRSGFISFFSYERKDFEYALCTIIQDNYNFNRAVGMLLMYAIEKSHCALDSYQRDFEDTMQEYINANGLYDYEEDETYPVSCTCQHCGKTYEFELTPEEANKYYDYLYFGKYLIQDVFPRGGMCGECWDKMFSGLEEYEEDDSEWDEDEFVETN